MCGFYKVGEPLCVLVTGVIPASAIIPTRDRAHILARTLNSLLDQDVLPAELIVVDASLDPTTRRELDGLAARTARKCDIRWIPAETCGAAAQRNQGVSASTQPFVWFFDDDILFQPGCVSEIWNAIESDTGLGGVSAMILNQRYQPPGRISRTVFATLHGRRERRFSGLVIGPAVNLLPEDSEDLPNLVPVEWLNTTCTLYRREALPAPPFDPMFTGYSLMEDLALSLRVGRVWRLANARTARVVHDSQPGPHKADVAALSKMELVNRHYVMTKILNRRQPTDFMKLIAWEVFQLVGSLSHPRGRSTFVQISRGKLQAVKHIGHLYCGAAR
jgi:glycosyltransferase involved in cell wall biosynthesis